jgi:hypothetical protein
LKRDFQMNERQQRISQLVRQNSRRAAKSEFIQRLSSLLRREFDDLSFVDLDTTNELRKLVGEGYVSAKDPREPGFARYFSRAEEAYVLSLVACLGTKIKGSPAFALFRQSEVCGAVSLEATEALANIRRLIEVDGDGPSVITADRNDGLLLDFNPDDEDTCYELVVWGEAWPILFLPCLSA